MVRLHVWRRSPSTDTGAADVRTTKRDIDRQLRAWPPRRIASWTFFVAALVIVAQHMLAHGGWRPLPFSMGAQDLVVGYPMAALLAVAGLLLVDPRPRI